jgi:HEAT repeats
MIFKRVFAMHLVVWLVIGCGRESSGRPENTPTPSGMKTAPPETPAQAPTSAHPAPASPGGGGCVDTVLIRAFAQLTSCNFKGGVIDFQCAAWKRVHKLIGERERLNKALVQLSLMRLLGDSDERVRLVAAKSLSSYAAQQSVSQRLINAYGREKNGFVRAWIVHSLHSPRPEAMGLVLKALATDTDAIVRARAAQRLNIAHPARNPAVARGLVKAIRTDKSVDVRKRAAESLGSLRPDQATENLLIECLKDPKIGPHCAIGLGRMRSQKGYESILTILRDSLKKEAVHPLYVWTIIDFVDRPYFRATVVRILLQRIVKSIKMPKGARHYAVKSLGRLGRAVANQKAAVLQFLKGLAGDKTLRLSVNLTLKRLGRSAAGSGGGSAR